MRTSLFLGVVLALGAGGALVPVDASAQNARAARAQTEGSMVLSGSIDIAPDGSVEGFTLKNEDRIEPYIQDFLKQNVARWRFEPVLREGRAVAAKTPVNLRLVARRASGEGMDVVLSSANFRNFDPKASDAVAIDRMPPPSFPRELMEMGGAGEVQLLLRVARDGTVDDVIAEQVNAYVAGSARAMQRMRDVMARSAVTAARKWAFIAPTTGASVDDPFWTVRVPVRFFYGGNGDRYGKWQVYIPGPKHSAPWKVNDVAADDAPDMLPDGGVYMVGVDNGPKLLTPLQG
ncbi:energy transducer TonB [Stenotrophomonas pennii]|uniref:energy transducer TonB n=1 Tax=Stenotrophomonas lacuserhaii TaxID=2760084 RepID=UPI00320ACBF2